jgi:hypothetical protein
MQSQYDKTMCALLEQQDHLLLLLPPLIGNVVLEEAVPDATPPHRRRLLPRARRRAPGSDVALARHSLLVRHSAGWQRATVAHERQVTRRRLLAAEAGSLTLRLCNVSEAACALQGSLDLRHEQT